MASKAYLRLLDKALCTVNVFAHPFEKKPELPLEWKAEFLMNRLLKQGKASGYTIEYIKQLIKEEQHG